MLNEKKLKGLIESIGVPVKRLNVGKESFLFFEIKGEPYYIKLSFSS